jgi:hypothetical protein
MMEMLKSFGRFLAILLICSACSIVSVWGLYSTKPTQAVGKPEPGSKMVSIHELPVEGLGIMRDLYPEISSMGPIKPYDIYCASEMHIGASYVLSKVIYPAWFYPGAEVSENTFCTTNVDYLRESFVLNPEFYYREVASGVAEFSDLMVADQAKFFTKDNELLFCRASEIGVFGRSFKELRYKNGIVIPYKIYALYTSRDLECTSNKTLVSSWKKQGFVEIPTPVSDPWN